MFFEGFDAHDRGGLRLAVTDDLDVILHLHATLVDCAGDDGSSACDVVSAVDAHEERLIDWPLRDLDFSVHRFEELEDSLFAKFGLCVLRGK